MKKTAAISNKIKTIGLLFVILMSSVIATTIYLNAKNEKDALIINIAGKQRMLTQKYQKMYFIFITIINIVFQNLIMQLKNLYIT